MLMQGVMMMTAGYFRRIPDLPKFFWRYPISYINYGAWGLQVILEHQYVLIREKILFYETDDQTSVFLNMP